MKFVGIKEGKTTLSELVKLAKAGERVVFTSNGEPSAVLGPFDMEAFEDFLVSRDEAYARKLAEDRNSKAPSLSSAEARAALDLPPSAAESKQAKSTRSKTKRA